MKEVTTQCHLLDANPPSHRFRLTAASADFTIIAHVSLTRVLITIVGQRRGVFWVDLVNVNYAMQRDIKASESAPWFTLWILTISGSFCMMRQTCRAVRRDFLGRCRPLIRQALVCLYLVFSTLSLRSVVFNITRPNDSQSGIPSSITNSNHNSSDLRDRQQNYNRPLAVRSRDCSLVDHCNLYNAH